MSQALSWGLAFSFLLEISSPVPGRSLGVTDVGPDR